jgi:hypothetical protein
MNFRIFFSPYQVESGVDCLELRPCTFCTVHIILYTFFYRGYLMMLVCSCKLTLLKFGRITPHTINFAEQFRIPPSQSGSYELSCSCQVIGFGRFSFLYWTDEIFPSPQFPTSFPSEGQHVEVRGPSSIGHS